MAHIRSIIGLCVFIIIGAPAVTSAQPRMDLLEDHASDGYVRVRARLGATLWETWRHARSVGDGTVTMDDIAAVNPSDMIYVCEGAASRRPVVYETCPGSRSRGFRFDTAYDIPLTRAGVAHLRAHVRPTRSHPPHPAAVAAAEDERRAAEDQYVHQLETERDDLARQRDDLARQMEEARAEVARLLRNELGRSAGSRASPPPPLMPSVGGSGSGRPWYAWLILGLGIGAALAMFWFSFWEFSRIKRRLWKDWAKAWGAVNAEVMAARRHGIEKRKALTAKFAEWRNNLTDALDWHRQANTELANELASKTQRVAQLEGDLALAHTSLQAPAAQDVPSVPTLKSSTDLLERVQTAEALNASLKQAVAAFEEHKRRIPALSKALEVMRPPEYKRLMAARLFTRNLEKEERESGRLDRISAVTFERMLAEYDAEIATFILAHPDDEYLAARMELVDRIRSATGLYADSVVAETWIEDYARELKVLIVEARAERDAFQALAKTLRQLEPASVRSEEDTKKIRISSPRPPAPEAAELARIRAELDDLKARVAVLEPLEGKLQALERNLHETTDSVVKLTMENADLRYRSGYRPSLNPLKEPLVPRATELTWEEHDTVEIMQPSAELLSFGRSVTQLADQLEGRPVERIPLDPAASVDLARILAHVQIEHPEQKGEYIPAFLLPFHLVQNHGGSLPPRRRSRTQRPPSGLS